ncbi:MAG: T9SS C-terminal target domain-containing protein, partial [Bacteroidetes bacterium]
NIRVFPNPTNGSVFIEGSLKTYNQLIINILSPDGRLLKSHSPSTLPYRTALPPGVWIVQIIGENFVWSKRILVF